MNNYDIKCKLIEEELKTFWPQWHVAKHLGGGAFGDVFEIFRDNFGIRESSALKMIQISDVEETKVLFFSQQEETDIRNQDEQATIPEVFLNEIQVMESLRGAPNIVAIEDFYLKEDVSSTTLFVRMELLTSFQQVMAERQRSRSPFTIPEILKIGRDVCTALMYCEGKGIIHRDIKPANLFVDGFGNYKVGDFGASKRLDTIHVAQTMTSIGTISYMAPEIFRGHSYNNTVDIYAVGLILYQLLNNGRMPFLPEEGAYATKDIDGANYQRLHGTPLPSLAGKTVGGARIDSRLDAAVRKACALNPEDRYKSAREFYEALTLAETKSRPEQVKKPQGSLAQQSLREDIQSPGAEVKPLNAKRPQGSLAQGKPSQKQMKSGIVTKERKIYLPVLLGLVFVLILVAVIGIFLRGSGKPSDVSISDNQDSTVQAEKENKADSEENDSSSMATDDSEENDSSSMAADDSEENDSSSTAADDSEEKDSSSMTADNSGEDVILDDGTYSATFTTDSKMFHVHELNEDKGILIVKDGNMIIHVTLASKNIVNLFPGTAEDAQKEGASVLEPTVEEMTYNDGSKEEVYGFDIPVTVIGEEFDCALLGTMGKWYDHKVKVSDPVMLLNSGETETSDEREEIHSTTVLESWSVYSIEQETTMYAEPYVDSEVVMELVSGWSIIIEEPAEQGNGWYRVSVWLGGAPTYGYIQIP